jgi:hypothetical protein
VQAIKQFAAVSIYMQMWALRKTGYDQETETGTLLVSACASWPNASFQRAGKRVAYDISNESFDSSSKSLGSIRVFMNERAKLLFTQALAPSQRDSHLLFTQALTTSQSDSHLLAFHKPPVRYTFQISYHFTVLLSTQENSF